MVARPESADHQETDDIGKVFGPDFQQSLSQFGIRERAAGNGQPEVKGQQGDGDGKDGITEEDQPLKADLILFVLRRVSGFSRFYWHALSYRLPALHMPGQSHRRDDLMQRDDYIEANRKMWDETADIHAAGYVAGLAQRVRAPDFSTFDDVEKSLFAQIGLKDKAVIQLGCNNGRELISVKKAGAGRCVGVDVSDKFIAQGTQLASLGGVDVEFVRSSVYDLPHEFYAAFDLVYITMGVLGWLPDLDAFFAIVSRLLRTDGQLFIYEMHPILNMFEGDKGLTAEASYFQAEPFVDEEGPDYLDPTQTVKSVSYWFPHKLSDVIGGCLKHGLNLTHFEEYGHDISAVYAAFEHLAKKPPLSYSLVARKTA